MSDLVGNPKDRFFRDAANMLVNFLQLLNDVIILLYEHIFVNFRSLNQGAL